MDLCFKQSEFSRTVYNDVKLGAYYTDLEHAERIGQLFDWPEEEVCVLEPSIGDGKAVGKVLKNCQDYSIFGVELNTNTYECLKSSEEVTYLLNEDFLRGVKISHNSFSFCFANPPYGVDQDNKKRLEQLFVEKIYGYLTNEAVLALVIPYYVLLDQKFIKSFVSKFCPVMTFRFDEKIYSSYKQIVVIAQKRRSISKNLKWVETYYQKVNSIEKLPFLPRLGEQCSKIKILPSSSEDIEYFTQIVFNADEHGVSLKNSSHYSEIGKVFPENFLAAELGHPPMPLKKDLLYLCALAGGGQGIVGNEENGDLHLQRGIVKKVTFQEVDEGKEGHGEVSVSSFSAIVLNIIENDGTITTLE